MRFVEIKAAQPHGVKPVRSLPGKVNEIWAMEVGRKL
jgi:hypothetical protein